MIAAKPASRPNVPHFSSGPCAKRPGWAPQNLKDAALGRSHRAKIGKAKLKLAIELTREVLEIPSGYRLGIVPGGLTPEETAEMFRKDRESFAAAVKAAGIPAPE